MLSLGSVVVTNVPHGYVTATVAGYDEDGYIVTTPLYGFGAPFHRYGTEVRPVPDETDDTFGTVFDEAVARFADRLADCDVVAEILGDF